MSSDRSPLSAPVSLAHTASASELVPPPTWISRHSHRHAPQTDIIQSPTRRPAHFPPAFASACPLVKLLWLCFFVLLAEASWSRADAAALVIRGARDTRQTRGSNRFRFSQPNHLRPNAGGAQIEMPNYQLILPGIPLPHSSAAYGHRFNPQSQLQQKFYETHPKCAPLFSDRESRVASAYTILVAHVLNFTSGGREVRVRIERVLKTQRRGALPSRSRGVARTLSLEYLLRKPKCKVGEHVKKQLKAGNSYIFYLTPDRQGRGLATVLWPPVPTSRSKLERVFTHLCEGPPNSTRPAHTDRHTADLMEFSCENIGRLKNYKAPETPTIERVDERTLRCTAASSLSHTFLFLLRDGAVDRSASNPLPLGDGRQQIEVSAPRVGAYICQAINVMGVTNSTPFIVDAHFQQPTTAPSLVVPRSSYSRTARPQSYRPTIKSTASTTLQPVPAEQSIQKYYTCPMCIHGQCILENDVETCECIRGYTGQYCEQLISRH